MEWEKMVLEIRGVETRSKLFSITLKETHKSTSLKNESFKKGFGLVQCKDPDTFKVLNKIGQLSKCDL